MLDDLVDDFVQFVFRIALIALLEGLDGVRKMSKSYGNYVALEDRPEEMFGKLMSASDALMARYFEILIGGDAAELAAVRSGAMHPMEAKKRLAAMIVAEYHGAEASERAREHFETKFQRREVPADARVYRLDGEIWICELMKQLGFVASTSEARRLVGQGAVRVDGRDLRSLGLRSYRRQLGVVGLDQPGVVVLQTLLLCVGLHVLDHRRLDVESDGLARGRRRPGETPGEVARSGSDIDHPLTGFQLQGLHYFVGLLPFGALGRFEYLRPVPGVVKPMVSAGSVLLCQASVRS